MKSTEGCAVGATLDALIVAFCRREKTLSCYGKTRWMVGAMGIEPTTSLLKLVDFTDHKFAHSAVAEKPEGTGESAEVVEKKQGENGRGEWI